MQPESDQYNLIVIRLGVGLVFYQPTIEHVFYYLYFYYLVGINQIQQDMLVIHL